MPNIWELLVGVMCVAIGIGGTLLVQHLRVPKIPFAIGDLVWLAGTESINNVTYPKAWRAEIVQVTPDTCIPHEG